MFLYRKKMFCFITMLVRQGLLCKRLNLYNPLFSRRCQFGHHLVFVIRTSDTNWFTNLIKVPYFEYISFRLKKIKNQRSNQIVLILLTWLGISISLLNTDNNLKICTCFFDYFLTYLQYNNFSTKA
jgi:hypothetical protein